MKEMMLAALLAFTPASTTQYTVDTDNKLVISMTMEKSGNTVMFGCYPLVPN